MKDLEILLLSKLNKVDIVNQILFLSNPVISNDLKKDLSTFFFTWKAVKNIYICKQNDVIIPYVINTIEESLKEYKLTSLSKNCNNYISYIQKHILRFNPLQRLLLMKKLNMLNI